MLVTSSESKPNTGTDDYGTPIYETVFTDSPAEMRPLGSSETVSPTSDIVKTRYRLFLAGTAVLDVATDITWRGTTYAVSGDVEQHTRNGRVHHQEVVVTRYSG